MQREIKIPEVGENVESIQVVRVLVAVGDKIAADQPVLELETGKAVVEVPSPEGGTVMQITVSEGDDVKVGQLFAVVEGSGEAESASEPVPEAAPVSETPDLPAESANADEAREAPPPLSAVTEAAVSSSRMIPAAPSIRKFARELGVDIARVRGSGAHGRVSRDDIKSFVREQRVETVGAPSTTAPKLPDFSKWGDVTEEKMSAIRVQTAAHMETCWSNIPHVTIHDKVDITELEQLRKKYAERAEKRGGKLTMAVMATRVVASALKQFPRFNASVDMANRSIIYKSYVNVGVAMATDRGLVVPVIRDTDGKNMVELAAEISEIAVRARKGQLKMDEMQGGTFTVTNLGRVGGSYFTPIINYPEVAILGMGRTFQESGVDRDAEPRTMLPLSLSFDHRIIDGA